MERKQLHSLAFFPAVVIYLELVTKLLCFGDVTVKGSALTILFSLTAGALLIGICSLFRDKAFMQAMITLTAAMCLVFAVQNVYFSIFGTFLSLDSTSEVRGVLNDFWRQALEGIGSAWREIFVSFLPLILLILFRKHFQPVSGKKVSLCV